MGAVLPEGRVALLSDIHGNYPAFRACYSDALAQGAESFVFLGDYISDLAEPDKVLDLVYEIRDNFPTVCLRGNRERYMLECLAGKTAFLPGSKTGSLLYTFERLRKKDLEFIQGLPISDSIRIGDTAMEIAHAVKDDDRFYFDTEDGNLPRAFSMMKGAFLLTGHSHKQYIRTKGSKTIINPGSVGVPRGYGNWTMYALLDVNGGKVNCQMRKLPYDIAEVIHTQFESGLAEFGKYWATGILYDVITGEEWTVNLLQKVLEQAGEEPDAVYDEALWHDHAHHMGMKFTEEEILADLERGNHGTDHSGA